MQYTADEKLLKDIRRAVKNSTYLNRNLDRGGKIVLDKMTPSLVVYRFAGDAPDRYFERIIKTQSAFIIAPDTYDLHSILQVISELQAERFNSYLVMELWESQATDFVIYGPTSKVSNTINTLRDGLKSLIPSGSDVIVSDTQYRHPSGLPELFTREAAKQLGVLIIGLEIPHFYGNREVRDIYYLKFRKLLPAISEVLSRTAFEFSRVQTNAGFDHFWRLGKSRINHAVRSVDTTLSSLSERIDFLLRVTPVNEHQQWLRFRENNFEKKPAFTYRLITIDPEEEKRLMFNVPIEKIQDPTLMHIYREKRNTLEKELIMLEERETDRFLSMSRNLYGEVKRETVDEAFRILKTTGGKEAVRDESFLDPGQFLEAAEKELGRYRDIFRDTGLKAEIRNDITGLMVSKGKLFIGESYQMPVIQCQAMIQHEIGTHILTYANGKRQSMQLLCRGLANYDELQEGLAVLMEYFAGGLTSDRLRTLAARVAAVEAVNEGADFIETFRILHLENGFDPKAAFHTTARVFRSGGYTKDAIYLQGLLSLLNYLREGGDLPILFAGKFALEHVRFINELIHREIISPPVVPAFLETEDAKNKLQRIREGLGPLDLIASENEYSIPGK